MIETLPQRPDASSELLSEPVRAEQPCCIGGTGGQQLYGDLRRMGVHLLRYDFPTACSVDWSKCFASQTVVLCLNLEGRASVQRAASTLEFLPRTAGFFGGGKRMLKATRHADQGHQFITAEFSAPYLRRYLSSSDGALNCQIEAFISGKARTAWLGEVWPLTQEQEAVVKRLLQPPVFQAARELWYQGQVLQLMAEFFFERRGEDELFCDRQKRLARERTAGVIAILKRELINPPTLEAIGREVGCSPFYLSRIFSQEAGMTIPQYLRKLRMERAAELLRGGKHNVTEAALAVGYSSLSHFSQAFCQTMGCCPGLYPLKNAIRRQ